MRALITGGTGFAGRHLAQHLIDCGDDVIVTHLSHKQDTQAEQLHLQINGSQGKFAGKSSSRADGSKSTLHLAGDKRKEQGVKDIIGKEIPLHPSVQSVILDVTDRKAVEQLVQFTVPDAIYHLAAVTFIPDGEKDPFGVIRVNSEGSLNIFEAIRIHAPNAKVLYVSSSEVYGQPRPGSLPLAEQAELRPISTYGLSKAMADIAAFEYSYKHRLDIVRVRPFAHTGPGQRSVFALSSFARQVAQIKLGLIPPCIHVGNLEAKRDYSDVSDIVRGYREAILNGKRGGAYNLCSGKSHSIGDLLKSLMSIAGLEAEVEVDETRLRPLDIPELNGSYQLAQKEFGWKPRIELEGMLHSLLAYWLESLS